MTTNDVIVLMQSVHKHMQMETFLEQERISFTTRIKPRQLGTDCGMVLAIDLSDVFRVEQIAKRKNTQIFGIYIRYEGAWKPFKPDQHQ
jgi:hypothetical protein